MSNMIPMTGYPVPLRPYSQITPFTYRDNSTYLEILEQLRTWIQNTLVPHLDSEYSELSASWAANIEELTQAVNTAIQDMIDQVANNSVEANDPTVTALINNVSSATRHALDAIYATDVDVTGINSAITALQTSVTALQSGLTSTNSTVAALSTTVSNNNTALTTSITTTNNNVSALTTTVNTNNTTLTALIAKSSPVGTIHAYGGGTAPDGFVMCDGSTYSTTGVQAPLFAIIGHAFGGSGTSFKVPNLQGRVPVGANGATFAGLGSTGGEETHTLTESEMPSHAHGGSWAQGYFTAGGISAVVSLPGMANNFNTASTGGGAAHNNIQPYQVVNYIIKYQ